VEMPGYKEIDGRTHRDEHEHDRNGRRDDRPNLDRAPAHRPRMNPVPRTAWISGGSPSLRRR